jgi:hypothetical protein
VECRPEAYWARTGFAIELQFVQQNWWMLEWLADNLLESPNAAIKAEHAMQVLRCFKVVSSFLILGQR